MHEFRTFIAGALFKSITHGNDDGSELDQAVLEDCYRYADDLIVKLADAVSARNHEFLVDVHEAALDVVMNPFEPDYDDWDF